ncbi:hypothetical protein BKA69DRAFT_1081022 [Paraphysoderma sedebokerense]|nr:hypothetical protein BKA69DRAFT_1081022 [Paraphysoderma sedebokerense]
MTIDTACPPQSEQPSLLSDVVDKTANPMDSLLNDLSSKLKDLNAESFPLGRNFTSTENIFNVSKILAYYSTYHLPVFQAIESKFSLSTTKSKSNPSRTVVESLVSNLVKSVYTFLMEQEILTPMHVYPLYQMSRSILSQELHQFVKEGEVVEQLLSDLFLSLNVQVNLLSAFGGSELLMSELLDSFDIVKSWDYVVMDDKVTAETQPSSEA